MAHVVEVKRNVLDTDQFKVNNLLICIVSIVSGEGFAASVQPLKPASSGSATLLYDMLACGSIIRTACKRGGGTGVERVDGIAKSTRTEDRLISFPRHLLSPRSGRDAPNPNKSRAVRASILDDTQTPGELPRRCHAKRPVPGNRS